MNEYIDLIIICVAVFVVLMVFFVIMPIIAYNAFFSKRQDRSPLLKYFSPQDFNLSFREIDITYRGAKLYGAVYSKQPIEKCEKLIIFAHGLGAGHCAYMTEIAYYCNRGFAVLAYDNYGCDRSEGKNIRSFYTGAECVIAAYIAAKGDAELKDKPVYLVGHSWGGYSVLCASQCVNAKGVVAISAFSSPVKVYYDLGGKKSILYAVLFTPMVALITALKNRAAGSKNAAKAIQKSGVPALLIWGENDKVVSKINSAACVAKGENISSVILPDKKHNPYNTVQAEQKLEELTSAFTKQFASDEEKANFFASFDYSAATQEDELVMQKTVDFING
jgi:hypothetical protein